MKTVKKIFILGAVLMLCSFRVQAECKISADRESALYSIGEKGRFIIIPADDTAEYTLSVKNNNTDLVKDEVCSGKREFEFSCDKPGSFFCTVVMKSGKKYLAGAITDPLNIKAIETVPEDFETWWTSVARQAIESAGKVQSTALKTEKDLEYFDIQVPMENGNGVPVSGYMCRPAGVQKAPVIISFHGAGVFSAREAEVRFWAEKGFIAFDFNAHGVLNGQSREYYKDKDKELYGYMLKGWEDRDLCYFKKMFERVAVAVNAAKNIPEWDGKKLIVTGPSQGGAQSIVAAALDQDVTHCLVNEPALCDLLFYTGDRRGGWPRPNYNLAVANSPVGKKRAPVIPYFDMVNFAGMIKNTEVRCVVGLCDHSCTPESVYAMFNAIASPNKTIYNAVRAAHGFTPEGKAFLYDSLISKGANK